MLLPYRFEIDEIQSFQKYIPLPLEVLLIIFKIKYELEKYELNSSEFGQKFIDIYNNLNLFTINRSGMSYMNYKKNMTIQEKFNYDSILLTNSSKKFSFCNNKPNFYRFLIRLANFVGDWYPLLNEVKELQTFRESLDEKIAWIHDEILIHNIGKKLICCNKHFNYCSDVIKDIYEYVFIYMKCKICNHNKNCEFCQDFRNYYYNYNYYISTKLVLRSGNFYKKPNCDKNLPLVIHKYIQI